MVEGWGGPRFWSAASRKLKKKLVSRFYARLVSYGKLGTTLGFRALPRHDFIILPPSLLCSMGGRESVHGTACDFAFGSGSALRFGGGEGVGLLLRTPFHFFDTVFSFGNVQCCNGRSAAVFGILYAVAMETGGLTMV